MTAIHATPRSYSAGPGSAGFRSRSLRLVSSVLVALALAGQSLALPPDVEAQVAARKDEVRVSLETAAKWKTLVKERESVVIASVPVFMKHHRAVQAVPLDAGERKVLVERGIEGLPADKASVFINASAPMVAMKGKMAKYFEAYDAFMAAEVHARANGAIVELFEKRLALEAVSKDRFKAKADALIDKALAAEAKYEEYRRDAEAKNHHLSNAIKTLFDRAGTAEAVLTKEMRAQGLVPKTPWGQRLKGFGRKIRNYARLTKIGASALPALGRMMAYLYNPFRKQPDPEKVTRILRFFSKSYRWAAGMKLTVEGAENLPEDHPVIFAFSHRSEIEDAMTMMGVIPGEYSFMVAQRAIPAFLNDKLVLEPSIINVGGWKNGDREFSDPANRVDAVTEGIESIKDGRHLAIFPEGTTSSPQQETRPLRSGIDVIASAVYEKPISIVAVSIDDPANDYDDPHHVSLERRIDVTVEFSRAIDPLKLKSVPGADSQLLLDVIRAFWHRSLYRPDVGIDPAAKAEAAGEEIGVIPESRGEHFEALYGEGP